MKYFVTALLSLRDKILVKKARDEPHRSVGTEYAELINQDNKMPNTYTQIHIQYVFAVKHRAAFIDRS